MKRLMGLDVGDKTIGVAISDLLMLTAQGLTTIRRKGIESDINEIKELVLKYDVEKIIIGLPKNMNNTIGSQGEKVLKFAEQLKQSLDMEIILQDERLTTVSAERTLISGDVKRKQRKKLVDMIAATYILQTYMEITKNRGE